MPKTKGVSVDQATNKGVYAEELATGLDWNAAMASGSVEERWSWGYRSAEEVVAI